LLSEPRLRGLRKQVELLDANFRRNRLGGCDKLAAGALKSLLGVDGAADG
jgi:hypothetical protein